MDGGLTGLGFAFHAAAPPGEWINDPNGLLFADGRYHLLAQHSAAEPDFRDIGWGRFTSPDLLSWEWAGVALPRTDDGSIYSGSVIAMAEGWEAFFTRHDPRGPFQTQHRATASAPGEWTVRPEPFGPAGRNMRDPFVFWSEVTADWRMLVAEPCDWTNWAEDAASRLQVWRSADLEAWEEAGPIGPWSPPGVLWEVPVLIDFGQQQALILSLVDRRSGQTECGIRYWLGSWDEQGFIPDPDWAADGLPLDLGPDFYAAVPNCAAGWPTDERIIVGWASSWRTAREIAWPGGAGGGPISLPRVVGLDRRHRRLRLVPIPEAESKVGWTADCDGDADFALLIERDDHRLEIRGRPGDSRIDVDRRGSDALQWSATHNGVLRGGRTRHFRLFVDGPLLEMFIAPEDIVLTAVLPGDGPLRIRLGSGAEA